jgi:undecaprenyl-diphosphatase
MAQPGSQRYDLDRPIAYDHLSRPWIVTALVAVLVAVVSGLVASSGDVPGWERWIFHRINDLPGWLEAPMWLFQLAGLLLVPLVVALGAAAARQWRLAASLVALVPIKLVVEKAVVKQLVERERPGTSICAGDASCGNFRDVPTEGLSFVSGHAIIAWSVATLLWPYLPGRLRWVPVGIAVANSVARVYLGAHNPLDVIGGGAIGVAVGALLTMAFGIPPRRPVARTSTRPA